VIDAFRGLQFLSLIGLFLILPSVSDQQEAAMRDDLRLTVRLLHVPTGRASMLYSSLRDTRDRVEGEREELLQIRSAPLPRVSAMFWSTMRLSSASPFPWVSCTTYAHFTTAEGAAFTKEDFHSSPSPPAWMKQSCFGFDTSGEVSLIPDDEGLHMQPAEYREWTAHRVVYRALQALPWTD